MVTRLSLVRVVATNHVFLVLRVLSDVPGQSAGDLVDGLTKAEEEVFRDIPAVIGPDNSAVPMCTVCWRSEMRCLIYTG